MPRMFRNRDNDEEGTLFIDEEFPNCVSIYYEPHPKKLEETGRNPKKAKSYRTKLLCVNGQDHYISIYPITTFSGDDFLQPKYSQIESITLDNSHYQAPETIEEVMGILEDLPSGFIKDYEYGLGLQKEYEFIINAVEKIKGVRHLVISQNEETSISKDIYTLSEDDYDAIRKGINRITNKQLTDGRIDKIILAHNALLSAVDPKKYPEQSRPYKKDTVFKLISGKSAAQNQFSDADKKEAIRLVSESSKDIARKQPEELLRLRNDIELVTLEELIQKFEEMLGRNLSEPRWQTLFNDNPFILNLAFGFPIIKIGQQASVGGRAFSGKGDKITDFLVKNNLTHNAALVEIKTPQTALLGKEYRSGICMPSSDLSGSINQLLDQRYRFQKEILSLKDNAGIIDLESYAVNCVLIIGKSPDKKDHKKSFELFRSNSKEVLIVTFDELLEKLKHLHAFLAISD